MIRFSTLRSRLTLAFMLVSLAPLAGASIAQGVASFQTQLAETISIERAQATRLSADVSAYLTGFEAQLATAAKTISALDIASSQSLLAALPAYPDSFQEISLLNKTGQELVVLSRLRIVRPADYKVVSADSPEYQAVYPAFQAVLEQNKPYYSPVFFDAATQEPTLTLALPIDDPLTGNLQNILVAQARFQPVWTFVASLAVAEGERVYITDQTGRLVADVNPSLVLAGTRRDLQKEGLSEGLTGSQVILAEQEILFGDQVFVVVAERATSTALSSAYNSVLIAAGAALLAALVSTFMGILAARSLASPILALSQAVGRVAEKRGQFTADDTIALPSLQARGEIGSLTRDFAQMFDQLRLAAIDRTQDLARRETLAKLSTSLITARNREEITTGFCLVLKESLGAYSVVLSNHAPDDFHLAVAARSGTYSLAIDRGQPLTVEELGMISTAAPLLGTRLDNLALVEEVLRADRMKTEFLATMSHELRTPLNAIINFALLIQKGSLPAEKVSELIDRIRANGLTLLNLVNPVLDLAKIDSGTYKLVIKPFLLREILEDTIKNNASLEGFLKKKIELIQELSPDLPHMVNLDKERLSQVLTNLLSNASKFTKQGQVTIRAFALSSAYFCVEVEDTGIGIPPNMMNRVFERFTQVDQGFGRAQGGTGLGLTIAKQLVERMGGTITLKSTVGVGSTFSIKLPVDVEQAASATVFEKVELR